MKRKEQKIRHLLVYAYNLRFVTVEICRLASRLLPVFVLPAPTSSSHYTFATCNYIYDST